MPFFRMLKKEIFGATELDEDGISSLVSLTQQVFIELVHQVSDWGSGVAIKMGRRQGATKEHI